MIVSSSPMTPTAAAQQPRIDGAAPFALMRVLGGDREIREKLRIDIAQLEPVGNGSMSTRIEVPPGEWLVWRDERWALWIGARPDALPRPVRDRLTNGDSEDIITLVDSLAMAGTWCRDAALLTDDGWTPSRRADAALAALATVRAAALSGVFVDREGRAARLEIALGGVCWTDRPALAVEWLLAAVDLPIPA
jgi:hypothetical protein